MISDALLVLQKLESDIRLFDLAVDCLTAQGWTEDDAAKHVAQRWDSKKQNTILSLIKQKKDNVPYGVLEISRRHPHIFQKICAKYIS